MGYYTPGLDSVIQKLVPGNIAEILYELSGGPVFPYRYLLLMSLPNQPGKTLENKEFCSLEI